MKFQWNFNEISITKFHKVSIFLKISLKFAEIFEFSWFFFEFSWNLLNTTLKFHSCQKCYEISLKFSEISLKFELNFTKVSIEISLKMTIEISEHYVLPTLCLVSRGKPCTTFSASDGTLIFKYRVEHQTLNQTTPCVVFGNFNSHF